MRAFLTILLSLFLSPDAAARLIERAIEPAGFPTERQKRATLYNNAARFLRLSDAQIAAHQGR